MKKTITQIDIPPIPAIGSTSPKFAMMGSILGALAASSCCILPLALFGLGVSGAWIGNLTKLAPYQPYFLAFAIANIGFGAWRVYKARQVVCEPGSACARPVNTSIVTSGLVLSALLVSAALSFNYVAPYFLGS
jgi:mercuric ion transport protein